MLSGPFTIPLVWVVNLLSLALIGGGVYLVWAWFAGIVVGTAYLVIGAMMLIWTFAGRWIVLLLLRRPGADEPNGVRGGSVQRLQRPDGTELQVEFYGPPDGQPIILTHGWGTNSTAWYYAKRQLGDRFRLIVWDLPGLGKSDRPKDGNYQTERMARDLEAVLAWAGEKPAILVGHSIGGMILLTFCRLFPEDLGRRVAGLVLVDTTYTNPVRTSTMSGLLTALQKPLLEPLLHLTIWLTPIVWLMDWLSYLNGSTQIVSALAGFAGHETRGQLDFASRFNPLASPAVRARGALAMFKYEETTTLSTVSVPALVLVGHLDRMTIPEASRHMSEMMPSARLTVLRPAGHMSVFEQNRRLADEVAAFSRPALLNATPSRGR